MRGYENAKGIDANAKIIVKLLKLIKTKKAIIHKIDAYKDANNIEIFPDAIGLFFVLSTIRSIFLSSISLTTQPADLIKIAPNKKNITYFINKKLLFEKSLARVNPQRQGQNRSKKPIGFFRRVNCKNNSKFFIIIFL